MKNSSQLLDLLSADNSEVVEPTKVVAAREQLYPDVCLYSDITGRNKVDAGNY